MSYNVGVTSNPGAISNFKLPVGTVTEPSEVTAMLASKLREANTFTAESNRFLIKANKQVKVFTGQETKQAIEISSLMQKEAKRIQHDNPTHKTIQQEKELGTRLTEENTRLKNAFLTLKPTKLEIVKAQLNLDWHNFRNKHFKDIGHRTFSPASLKANKVNVRADQRMDEKIKREEALKESTELLFRMQPFRKYAEPMSRLKEYADFLSMRIKSIDLVDKILTLEKKVKSNLSQVEINEIKAELLVHSKVNLPYHIEVTAKKQLDKKIKLLGRRLDTIEKGGIDLDRSKIKKTLYTAQVTQTMRNIGNGTN